MADNDPLDTIAQRQRFAKLQQQKANLEAQLAPHQAKIDSIAKQEGDLRAARRLIVADMDPIRAQIRETDSKMAMISRALRGQVGLNLKA